MATLDVLTLAEAKSALNLSGTAQYDTELAAWITACSIRLDKAVGPIVRRAVTAELHDGGKSKVRTELWPVNTFTTVTEYLFTTPTVLTRETNASKPDNAYTAEPYSADPTLFSGRIIRRNTGNDFRFPSGRQNVEITYDAGRFVNTATIDEFFKQGARYLLINAWNTQRPNVGAVGEFEIPQGNSPHVAVPNVVRDHFIDVWQDGDVLVG